MAWTIHRFETMFLPIGFLDEEYILSVFEIVTASFPQLGAIDIGRKDFLISSYFVLGSHEFHQPVVDDGSVGEEHGATWGHCAEMEEILFGADVSMISFG